MYELKRDTEQIGLKKYKELLISELTQKAAQTLGTDEDDGAAAVAPRAYVPIVTNPIEKISEKNI